MNPGEMNLEKWAQVANRHRNAVILTTLVTTFSGLALVIDRPKGTILEWLALPLFVVGGALFAWAVWPRGETAALRNDSMASRLLHVVTLDGKLVTLFPALGVGIVLADFGYNWFLSATPAIQTEDTIVLLAAATLLAYPFVPFRFSRERDFVLLFFLCLNAILVVPLLIARAYYADFEHSVDVYSWVALAPETSAILQSIGITNTVHPIAGSTAPGLTFTPEHMSTGVTVVITTACSGIYSFGIFASAFIAFVTTEHARASPRTWLLLGLGLVTAYLANILRMVAIILVGFYTDSPATDLQNMLIAHSYAGWLIFLGWIALFWGLLFTFLPEERTQTVREDVPTRRVTSGPRCSICSTDLTVSVPAIRCGCGAFYHRQCLVAAHECPSCGRRAQVDGTLNYSATKQ